MRIDQETGEVVPYLDLFSITQTNHRCAYGAPLVAVQRGYKATIKQACCNHWDCPACGIVRAKEEYHRIVWGSERLADEGHLLYFWTLTCRGKECSLEEAEENYYAWTNTLLTNTRTHAKRKGMHWAYVQVTERQKRTRAHPHSHLLTTFLPEDARETKDEKGRDTLVSAWLSRANASANLGSQFKITRANDVSAVSRYIAKYMFKDSMNEHWPPHWRRVRYSHNWPKPPKTPADVSITLLRPQDWQRAAQVDVTWVCEDQIAYERARHRLGNITLAQWQND